MLKRIKQIYNIQLLISAVFLALFLYDDINSGKETVQWTVIESVSLAGAVIVYFLNHVHQLNYYLDKVRQLFSLTIVSSAILVVFARILFKLNKALPNTTVIWQITYLLGILVVLLPIGYVEYGQIRSNWARLLSVPILTESIIFFGNSRITGNVDWLNDLIRSGLVWGFALIIFACVVVHRWGIKFNFIFKPKKTADFQLWVLIILLVFTVWYVLVYGMIETADNFSQAFWNFQFNLLDINNSAQFETATSAIFSAMEAGVFEETERYLTIVTAAMLLKKSKFRLDLTILISAAIFALLHYGNIWTQNRTFQSVTIQVLVTFGFGSFMAVLYLYTGQMWLNILAHTCVDLLFFSQTYISGGLGLLNGYSLNFFITTACEAGVPIIFTIFMLFGKRRKFMEENINILVEKLA